MAEIINAANGLSWPGAFTVVGVSLAPAWMISGIR